MGKRTQHPPGTFSWVDLTTNDADGAKAFYAPLFGWELQDNPIPGTDAVYTMCMVDGEAVAAIPSSTDMAPPHWNSYVTVASADETAAKAKELGATLIEEPFDVMTAGRMAIIKAPDGAVFCIWQPGDNIGAGRVNEPGCLTWNELHSPDPAKALEFYTGLFGWNSEAMDTGDADMTYTIVKVGDRSNGGVTEAQQGEPPHWVPYFVVESCEDACAKATDLGGKEWVRFEMPMGRAAVLSDPQGAPFAAWEGEVDD